MFSSGMSRSTASSASLISVPVKSRSSVVNGVPSCQTAPGLMRQVISIRPSGMTFQRPFSREGTDSASSGCRTLRSSTWVRPAFTTSSTSSFPGVLPEPAWSIFE